MTVEVQTTTLYAQEAENGGLAVSKPRQTTKNAAVEPKVVV